MRRQGALMGSFAIDLVAMTFGMPRALFAVLALTVFDAGAAGTGLLYASVSAGASVAALTTGWVEQREPARPGGDRRRLRLGPRDRRRRPDALDLAGRGAAWRSPARADSVSAVCRSIINQTTTPEALRGRMSAIFMLVVTSGPRLGDLESGIAASLMGVGAAVVTGGLACVAGVGVIVLALPGARGLRRAQRRR